MVAHFLSNVAEKLNYLSGILLINCEDNETEFERCRDENKEKAKEKDIDIYPMITLFIPPELKFNPYTKKFNKHYEKMYDKQEISENFIYNFITANILNKGKKLNDDNIDDFLANNEFNKLLLFTDKKQTPLIFRGLSNYFYSQLLFGEVEKSQDKLIKRFKIQSFPTLMVYKTLEYLDDILDEPILEFYKGKVNAKAIVEFLSEFALKSKKYLETNENFDTTHIDYVKAVKEIKDEDFNISFFEKNKNKRIVLYISNHKDSNDDLVPDVVRKLYFNTSGFFYFYRFNCNEKKDICSKGLKGHELPALLLINKNLNIKDFSNINNIIDKADKLPLDYDDIQNEILKFFPSELDYINPSNFQSSLQRAIVEKKIPIVYLYEDQVPLGLHLISIDSKYREHLSIFGFESPPKEILKNLQVNKLPELTLVINDPSNPGRYNKN